MKNKIVQNPPQLEDGFRNALSLVAATFGPNGGNVSIAGTSQRLSFDDGLKALQNYEPVDPIENESVRRLLDAADMQRIRRIDMLTGGNFKSFELNICYPVAWGKEGVEARLASLFL